MALPPVTPLAAALAVVIVQALDGRPEAASSDFPPYARAGVLVMLWIIVAAAVAAALSAARRERPGALPVLALLTNAVLIGLFWHLEFYALGFDQDAWAPR